MTLTPDNEGLIRFSVFASVFALMALAETLLPRKQRVLGRARRWFTNVALVVVDTVLLRVLVPVLAVGAADWAERNGWGLFNLLSEPPWLAVPAAVVLLDGLIYLQHVVSHRVPVFWRFHRVHHADRDIDVTTGARFHPVEILASMLFKIACVVALGAPALAVFLFEVILNAAATFNHANLRIAPGLDRVLRLIVVTPDMHRVHHSVRVRETDSNFGFCLSLWDRLFGTYIAQPADGHDDMRIGLGAYQDERPASLWFSLALPFERAAASARAGTAPVADGDD